MKGIISLAQDGKSVVIILEHGFLGGIDPAEKSDSPEQLFNLLGDGHSAFIDVLGEKDKIIKSFWVQVKKHP